MLQNMFIKSMLLVPSTICTSLRKGQPTLLAQEVLFWNISVKQEQSINVLANSLSEATAGLLWQSLSYVELVVQTS